MKAILTRLLRLLSLPLFATLAGAGAVYADEAADREAIVDLYTRWDSAVMASSIEGYKSVLDENVRLLLPGAPDMVGREAYGQFLTKVLPQASYKLTLMSPIDVQVLGDYALALYHKRVDMTLRDSSNAVVEPGAVTAQSSVNKYFDVLHRQPDGGWRIYRHAWTQSELQPAPVTE